jgi:uncharacterized coiled-coil protein SlyX
LRNVLQLTIAMEFIKPIMEYVTGLHDKLQASEATVDKLTAQVSEKTAALNQMNAHVHKVTVGLSSCADWLRNTMQDTPTTQDYTQAQLAEKTATIGALQAEVRMLTEQLKEQSKRTRHFEFRHRNDTDALRDACNFWMEKAFMAAEDAEQERDTAMVERSDLSQVLGEALFGKTPHGAPGDEWAVYSLDDLVSLAAERLKSLNDK